MAFERVVLPSPPQKSRLTDSQGLPGSWQCGLAPGDEVRSLWLAGGLQWEKWLPGRLFKKNWGWETRLGGQGDRKGTGSHPPAHQAPPWPRIWVRSVTLPSHAPSSGCLQMEPVSLLIYCPLPRLPFPSLPCLDAWLVTLTDTVHASPPPGSLPDWMAGVS